MLKLNKYLKEIGIDEKYWLFEEPREIDKDGFIHEEFYNLDWVIAATIYSYLKYYQEYCNVACPVNMTFEKWNDILNKMIKGFKLFITDDLDSKSHRKQFNYGLRLFIKYFTALWY